MLLPVFALLLSGSVLAYDNTLAFNNRPIVENRTIDEIYQAALAEGGVVTAWHGGDERNQQDALKQSFEQRFPGMTLNITVDLSKYHDTNLDQQIANGNVYVDSIILQTLHDYPRWKKGGVLLNYAPLNFEAVYPDFRDSEAAYFGYFVFFWSNTWNTDKYTGPAPGDFMDYLRPEFRDQLVLTYPNDDDAVLYAFDLIMQQYGTAWFDALLAQNPQWVRGTGTPLTIISQPNSTRSVTFTSIPGLNVAAPLNISFPGHRPGAAPFVTWPQTAAILRAAPHPEAAKLLHCYLLSDELQSSGLTWSVRRDIPPPAGYPGIMEVRGTNPTTFAQFESDRERVETLKNFFESRIGTAQGLSPLVDAI